MTSPPTTASATELKPGPVCSVCPLYHSCRAICEPVQELLPSVERGRVDPEDLPRLYAGMRLTNAILDNLGLLTPHQQEVVRLYYREGLLQHEIAARLQVSQQAVNDTLRRAPQTIGAAFKGAAISRNGRLRPHSVRHRHSRGQRP